MISNSHGLNTGLPNSAASDPPPELNAFLASWTLEDEVGFLATEAPYTAADGRFHESQYDFVMSGHTLTAFVAGIDGGKTYSGCIRALRAAYGWIGNYQIAVPNKGMITAPTYKVLRDPVVETFKEIAEPFITSIQWVSDIDSHNESTGIILLANGSRIICRSSEKPELLRGPTIAWWFGDEAALYREMVYKVMIGRLRQGGVLGHGWIGTTPKGRNWVWQRFVKRATKHHRLIKAVTRDNVFMADEFFELLESEYDGDFARQELEGIFIAYQGLVYPEFQLDVHATRLYDDTEAHRPGHFYAGVDWGFANPGVIMVGKVDYDSNVLMVEEAYHRQKRIEEWVEIATALRGKWGIEKFYCDPSEPKYIQAFVDAGLPAVKAKNDVLPGIQAVKNMLVISPVTKRPKLEYVAGSCPNSFNEYEMYTWVEHKEHGMQDKPVKANDHTKDAERYLIFNLPGTRKTRLPRAKMVRTI